MQEVGVTEGENLPALLLQALLSCFQECVLACTSLLRLCIWIEEDGPAWPLFGTKRQLSTYSSHYSSVTNYKAQYFSVSNILAGSQSSVIVAISHLTIFMALAHVASLPLPDKKGSCIALESDLLTV